MFHPRCRHGLGTYYPELEDINGYETEDNKLNDYGSQQANEAHIDNMIQRYKRLTLGSLDPDNVKRYRERLEYWEERKAELAGDTDRMAADDLNDWSETKSRIISKEEKQDIINYAKEKAVNIVDLGLFDGDTELLKEQIDTIAKWKEILPVKHKVTLKPMKLDAETDFGQLFNRTIGIHYEALRNREITNDNINRSGYFASTDICDISVHEYGHLFVKENGINAIDICKKAYYNIYKRDLTDEELFDFFRENVSFYSSSKGKSELISELLAKHNSNPNEYTSEVIKLLKRG